MMPSKEVDLQIMSALAEGRSDVEISEALDVSIEHIGEVKKDNASDIEALKQNKRGE